MVNTVGDKKDMSAEEFPEALRAAIQARGLSLERIRWHLIQRGHELSVATISYWQSGRSQPERATSLAALAQMEEILQVPTGSLSQRLAARRRHGGTGLSEVSAMVGRQLPAQVEEMVAEWGLAGPPGLHRVTVHDRLEIGPSHRLVVHEVKELLLADQDGVDRYFLAHGTNGAATNIEVKPQRNCHVGRVVPAPEEGLLLGEMVLDRALRPGETILVEYEVVVADPMPREYVERSFVRPVRSAHTEVLFREGALPLSAERYTVTDGVERVDPVVIAGPSLHTLVLDFGPGTYGVRWRW
ncbi:hypothetical protein [Austwickia sp. TVS 96-490-7B]|uniref:helix-turn-helix domain-containing protein n=1 Tax=Austwickia sp. TVS 96-490-7B TaxID=2830843 RepID=UPI001C5671FC|nr:hypothetical protein [Austwickia sp. TVS 96-490-7B]